MCFKTATAGDGELSTLKLRQPLLRRLSWSLLFERRTGSRVPLFQLPQQIWASVRRPVRNRLISQGPLGTKAHLDTRGE